MKDRKVEGEEEGGKKRESTCVCVCVCPLVP